MTSQIGNYINIQEIDQLHSNTINSIRGERLVLHVTDLGTVN